MEKIPYQLALVSDLHLSEGWDEDGFLQKKEDFFFDNSFKRFLSYLGEKAKEGGFHYRLVINGDFVDFLQFTTPPEEEAVAGETITKRERSVGLGTGETKTLWKLDQLVKGHKVFFTAIADFLTKGHQLFILPGNHDIEWVMPRVQESFKQHVSGLVEAGVDLGDRITFLPWFYYDLLLSVFVEHGSQYDDINSFDYFLWPYRKDGTLDLPAGSFFVRYLFNRIEELYPFADNMKPLTKFIGWALMRFQTYRGWPPQIVKFFQFFWNTLKKAGPAGKDWVKELQEKQTQEIGKLARVSGMDEAKLEALKGHWVQSALHHHRWLGLFKSFYRNAKLDKWYYQDRAREVQQVVGSRYVIFGHTHEADLCTLSTSPDGKKNEYVNSGSWTKSFASNYEEALLKEENEFVYVHIGYDEKKKEIKMDLLRWDDSLQEGERVKLFRSRKDQSKGGVHGKP
jgi:UDP-2,3-diacylglucosamine pyrophosphatase LpxH